MLRLLSDALRAAWTSFERPRPSEPALPSRLAAALDAALPDLPSAPETALADAARVLDSSHCPSRPLFLAYVGSTGLEAGVLGAALMAAYDVNMAVAPGAVEALEEQALGWIGQLVGYPPADGAFTSGGMISNLTALAAARERALPGSRRHGYRGAGAVYCSAEAHHSVARAVEISGLGSESLRNIPIDAQRRMRTSALRAAIARDRAQGVTPIAVVATAGTTLTGAVDPLAEIATVCAEHATWMHVDGAYGLPAAAAPSTRALFEGLDRADSVTVDAHKWLGIQKSCSVVMLRNRGPLSDAFHHDEQYMVHREGAFNAVDATLEYSRPSRSIPIWLALRIYGAGAFRAWIEQTLGHARAFADSLRGDAAFELLHEPMLSAVCFRHLPGHGSDVDAHNSRLAQAIADDGRVYLAGAVVDGRHCLRVCFVNFRTRRDDLATLLAVVREIAGGC